MARVLVTDSGRGSAISVIRSLGAAGHEVIAADSNPRSPGFRSRYTTEKVLYPSPKQAPEAAARTLFCAARELAVDLIVPVTDNVILPLLSLRGELPEATKLAIPDSEALAFAADKDATLALCRELKIPTPQSVLVEDVKEANRAADQFGWPLVVKPASSRQYREDDQEIDSFEVKYAGNRGQLLRQMHRYEGRCPVVLQEYYPGEGHGVELLLDNGHPIAAFQHRRLREVPFTGGASSFRESVPLDPVLYEHATRLMSALQWTGLAMVEFKVGDRGPMVMEINGRIWGSLPLAIKSGVDFPTYLVDLFLPEQRTTWPPRSVTYSGGVRSRNLDLEMVWIGSVLSRNRRYPFLDSPKPRDAFAAALRLPLPADGFDVLSLSDPGPSLGELWRIAGKLRTKVQRAS